MGVVDRDSRRVAQLLRDQAYRLANPAASLAVEAVRLEAIVDEAFVAGRSPAGRAWPQLVRASRDSRTGRATPRHDVSGTPGRRTGRLQAAQDVSSDGRTISATNTVPYAAYRQWGTRKGGRRLMAARAILPVTGAGRPVRTGPAGDWYRALHDRLARYVVTGREQ
jgi:phage gpG-like protein